MTCTRHHSQYLYNASAFALAAEFERPKRYSLPPHASVVLASHGGHGTNTHSGLKVDGLLSFENAYSEVGGSYDECHNTYTTYAVAVLEGVNVSDMLTADRVVSRIAIYHPADPPDGKGKTVQEASFDFTGSYFENLRIAGHKLDIKLATHTLHKYSRYSEFHKAHESPEVQRLMLGQGLSSLKPAELAALEDEYHALTGMSQMVAKWKKTQSSGQVFRLSAANHFDLRQQIGDSELQGYGAVICIPKFGVIRLAEMVVGPHSRSLTMFRVQMCSSGHGTSDGGSTGGGSVPGGS
jgi:hypothetical protein